MASLLGADYESSDDETARSQSQTTVPTATKIVAAPEVNTEVWSLKFLLLSSLRFVYASFSYSITSRSTVAC